MRQPKNKKEIIKILSKNQKVIKNKYFRILRKIKFKIQKI